MIKVKSTIEAAIKQGYRLVNTRYFIGNDHLILRKRVAKDIVQILDSDELLFDGRVLDSDKVVTAVIPKQYVGRPFIATRKFSSNSVRPIPYITNEKTVFNSRYYWLVCEKLGLEIRPTARGKKRHTSTWAICEKNGKIVGAIMPVHPRVLE